MRRWVQFTMWCMLTSWLRGAKADTLLHQIHFYRKSFAFDNAATSMSQSMIRSRWKNENRKKKNGKRKTILGALLSTRWNSDRSVIEGLWHQYYATWKWKKENSALSVTCTKYKLWCVSPMHQPSLLWRQSIALCNVNSFQFKGSRTLRWFLSCAPSSSFELAH